jgi:hypothetical protein
MILQLKRGSTFKTVAANYFIYYFGCKYKRNVLEVIRKIKKQKTKNLALDNMVDDFIYRVDDTSFFVIHYYDIKLAYFVLDVFCGDIKNYRR